MNKLSKLLLGAILLSSLFLSCEKDENKVFYEGGAAPVLTASATGPLALDIANKPNQAVLFSWTNPNYQFTTGISSQDVTYTLQIDTTGANFSNPKGTTKTVAKDLSISFTVGELNQILADMDLKENISHDMEFRIKSTIGTSVPLYSNVVKIKVTPYLDVKYPVPAKLFITGAATPASWMGGGDPEVASQKFTQISNIEFQIASLAIKADQGFLFVPVYGDWSNKYGFTGAGLSNNVYGDDFKPNGNDFKSPPVAGNYKITVNFKTGKYKFEKI